MKYKRKKYGLLIIVTLLLVSVGYALINTTLKLNGSSKIKKARWNIYFDKVEHESGVTSTETKIDDKKTTVSFDIDLEKPGDYYQFNVDTVNDGTIDAIIDSTELTGLTNTTKEIIDYDVTYSDGSSVNKCDILNSGDRKTLLVKVKYFDDVKEDELLENNENLKLKFKINYVQNGTCDRNPVLEIDPNGGKYNNSRKVTKRNVEKNSSLTIPEAEREGYNFINWKTSSGVDLEKDSETKLTTINVGTSDIKVIAEWQEAIDPALVKHTITIDPNGGLYNGSEEVLTYQKKKNETVEVDGTIEREGYIFKGWNVDPAESSFVGNVLTVGLTDVTLTATWELDQEKVVAKIGNKYYTTLQKAFNAAVTGDKIELLKDIEEVSTNTKEVSLDLGNHTINGTINNSGILTVDNGKIQNLTVGQAPIVNTGTIIIGTNDERVIQDSIILYGKTTGLVQNGQFYFYDGYIEGDVAFKGGYNGCAENYIVYVDHDNVLNCQKAYLTLTSPDAVVKVRSSAVEQGGPQLYVYFKSLGDGIRYTTNDNPDVYALKSFADSENITIAEGQVLNINLEGFTISEGAKITNNGTLTIKDTEQNHGVFKTETYSITNNGTFNLSNVNVSQTMNNVNTLENNGNMNFSNSTVQATNKYALYNKTTGTLTFTNDTYFRSNSGYSFYNDSTEVVTLTGGNFQGIHNKGKDLILDGTTITNPSDNYAIYNDTSSKITLRNLTATSSNSSYSLIDNYGVLYIESGTYTSTSNILVNESGATTNITGGTMTSSGSSTISGAGTINISGNDTLINNTCSYGEAIYINRSTVNINGGTIKGSTKAIELYTGTLNVNGGSITNTSTSYPAIDSDIYWNGTGYINIRGGEIISDNNTAFKISSGDNYVNITGGLIKGKIYGVQSSSYDTILTIGSNDGVIDPDLPDRKPIIMGDTYGLYKSSGTVNFYDGIIKGKNSSVYYGTFDDVPDGTQLIKDTETIDDQTYYVAYLNNLNNFLQVGTKEFNSINKAVKEITDNYSGTGTITVVRDGYIYNSQSISSGKNITLDLNGNKINSTATITNNGTLTIVDNSIDDGTGKKGTIENSTTDSILNKGTLVVNEGNFNSYTENAINSSSGTVTINDGTFTSTSGSNVNSESTTLKIYGGSYNSTSGSTIYISAGTDEIKNATITNPGGLAIYNRGYTLTADNVTITNSKNGIYNQRTLNLNNSTINVTDTGVDNNTGGSSYANPISYVTNSNITAGNIGVEVDSHSSSLVFNSGTINSDVYGIYSHRSNVTILDGTIYGKNSGIYLTSYYAGETNNIVLGNNSDQTVADVTKPVIIGDSIGINNAYGIGNISFYDGIIKSKGAQVNTSISTIPDEYITINGIDSEDSSYKTTYLAKQEPFIEVGGERFSSLQLAINKAGTNGTMKLVRDGLINNNATIQSTQDIIFDLNGYTMSTTKTITNNGTFKIVDNSNDKNGKINSIMSSQIITNKNNLTIESGTLQGNTTVIENNSGATVTLDGGSLLSNGEVISNSGTFTINGGVIDNITTGGYSLIANTGTMNITGGIIGENDKSSNQTIYNGNGTLNISDTADIRGNNECIYATGGTINISGGNIYSSSSTAVEMVGATLNIIEGTIKSAGAAGIYVRSSSKVNVKGGEVIGKTYGINQYSGTLTIGEKDSEINFIPRIKGETYGLYKTGGTTQFYDGILIGKNSDVYSGTINDLATDTIISSGTEVDPDTDETYYTRFLTQQVEIVENKNTSTRYNNLQTAITEASSGDELELVSNASIYYNVTIPDKTLKLDLNNYNLITTKPIINNGTLTIIDEKTSGTKGKISTTTDINLLTNNKSLTINNISLQNNSTNNYVLTNGNNSTLNLTNVDINSRYGISNSGNLTMNSSNITTNYYSIYNDEGSLINITGGTIKATEYSYASIYVNNSSNNVCDVTIRNANIFKGMTLYRYANTKIYNSHTYSINIDSTSSLLFDEGTVDGKISNYGNLELNNIVLSNSGNDALDNYASLEKLVKVSNSTITVTNMYSDITGAVVNTGNIELRNTNININNSNYNNADKPAFYNKNSGKFKYIGGSIDVNNSYYGIKNETSSSVNNIIALDEVKVHNSSNGYGIYNLSGTLTILSGDISAYDNTNSYGIYQTGGEVILGTYDGSGLYSADVSTTEPYIKAIGTSSGTGAKRTSGTFRFFDGRLEGSTASNPEAPTQIEPNYIVKTYTSVTTGNEYAILECLSDKSASDIVDWNVKITDDDIVKSRTFSVDDVPWVDGNNNPVAQLQYGAIGNITIRIDGTSMSSDFKYKINVTMADGSPIEVTNNNHEEIMDISEETIKSFTVVLTCSSPTADYTQVDKNIPILITIEKVEN